MADSDSNRSTPSPSFKKSKDSKSINSTTKGEFKSRVRINKPKIVRQESKKLDFEKIKAFEEKKKNKQISKTVDIESETLDSDVNIKVNDFENFKEPVIEKLDIQPGKIKSPLVIKQQQESDVLPIKSTKENQENDKDKDKSPIITKDIEIEKSTNIDTLKDQENPNSKNSIDSIPVKETSESNETNDKEKLEIKSDDEKEIEKTIAVKEEKPSIQEKPKDVPQDSNIEKGISIVDENIEIENATKERNESNEIKDKIAVKENHEDYSNTKLEINVQENTISEKSILEIGADKKISSKSPKNSVTIIDTKQKPIEPEPMKLKKPSRNREIVKKARSISHRPARAISMAREDLISDNSLKEMETENIIERLEKSLAELEIKRGLLHKLFDKCTIEVERIQEDKRVIVEQRKIAEELEEQFKDIYDKKLKSSSATELPFRSPSRRKQISISQPGFVSGSLKLEDIKKQHDVKGLILEARARSDSAAKTPDKKNKKVDFS